MNTKHPHRSLRLAVAAAIGITSVFCRPASAQPASGTQPAPQREPEVWRMTVRPQPTTRPALQYALLPQPAEQVSGNAAPLYLLAMSQARQIEVPPIDAAELARKGLPPSDEDDMMYYYLGLPLDRIPVAELEAFLAPYEPALKSLDAATRREFCRWDLPVREWGFETPIPYLNDARHLTNVASMQARLHAARGDHAAAARASGGIFQMGLDVAGDGLLIQSLVGTGLGAVGVDRIKELIETPGSPNLYWALANLPRPFIDLRETIEWERVGLLASLPQLQRAAEGQAWTAADWNKFVERQSQLGLITGTREPGVTSLGASLTPSATGAVLYPEAKRHLLARGTPADRVEQMPVPEVLGRYIVGEYEEAFDEMLKWAGLPYWQAHPGMMQAQRTLFSASASVPVRAILNAVPAVARAGSVFAKLDSRVAALQTVEAVRDYAAEHDGKLPATLEAINADGDTPVPLNPLTGQPFSYRVEGGRAVIEIEPVKGDPRQSGLRVEMTIGK